MEALILRARRTGDPVVPVRVDARLGAPPPRGPASDHADRAFRTIRAFERIFSETCPASVLKFVQRAGDATQGALAAAGLDVKIAITWPVAPTWTGARGAEPIVHAPKFVFDVVLRGETAADVASFHLTMPPPDAPPTSVRTRSLFVVASGQTGDGGLDDSVYPLLSARAFDRLYDEIYGLFFRGDPRVPLREEEGGAEP